MTPPGFTFTATGAANVNLGADCRQPSPSLREDGRRAGGPGFESRRSPHGPRVGDTAWSMSQANVDAFKRAVDAINRRDIDKLLEELDPEVEWHDVFSLMLGGDAAVYRGHEGVRELFRDLFGAFAETHSTYSEIRDLGDRTVATGSLRTRGNESRAETESLVGTISDYTNARAIRVRTYLDPDEALEAAGLQE